MGTCLLPTAQLVTLYHLLVHVVSFFFIHLAIKSIITFHVSFTGLNVQGVSNPRAVQKEGDATALNSFILVSKRRLK